MIDKLEQLTSEIAARHSKLILMIGAPSARKTLLLRAFGERAGAEILNVGAEVGLRLVALPQKQRALEVNSVLRDLADQHVKGDLLLLDNIELLFDRTLQLDPLDLLKSHAHARRVVAVWPGMLRDGRLSYAELGHPEYQNYGLDGLIPFEIEAKE